RPPSGVWGFRQDYLAPSGALWLWFPGGISGNLTFLSDNVTAFPFAIQLTWVPQDGVPEPLFFGYEVDFRHQEANLSAGAGGRRVESQLFGPSLPPFSAGVTDLHVTRERPGHLALVWDGLPNGLRVGGDLDLGAGLANHTLLPALLVRLDVDNDGLQAYTPIAQVEQGEGRTTVPLPHFVSLRLIVPTNLGHGRVAMTGPALQWERQVPDRTDPSCIDCFEVKRFVGTLDEPWEFSITYAGRSANFQAYLTVAEAPRLLRAASPNQLFEHRDCATAFAGKCP
ncbi:MAG TPA: hypothetical protein VHI93_09155, partial [Candidatus Thermoplasmatota archaeon]|nr:hypothetical protein [Candidatus Thermoplasmatota archaeon]